MYLRLPAARSVLLLALALLPLAPQPAAAQGAANTEFVPVTNEMHENPAPGDWLMWRRTQNGWGYSPLDQINRDNVDQLRMVWTRALREGTNQATPIAYGGVLYEPNPSHATQAIDALTGDLLWEYVRPIPEDANDYIRGLVQVNRSAAIYGNLIIDTANDGYVYALDAQSSADWSGTAVWKACPGPKRCRQGAGRHRPRTGDGT